MAPKTEIAVGLERGHRVIKNKQTPRPASRKGVSFLKYFDFVFASMLPAGL